MKDDLEYNGKSNAIVYRRGCSKTVRWPLLLHNSIISSFFIKLLFPE